MRFLLTLVLTGALAIVGCGDDGGGGAGSGGDGATGGGTAGTGGAGATGGTGGTATGGTGGTATGGTGGDTGGSAAAKAFCQDFERVCSFGGSGRYADQDDCVTSYDGYASGRQSCVEEHLGNADTGNVGDVATHCPHAAGVAICT